MDTTHVNARSIRNKAPQVQLEIGAQRIDVCAITETWLRPSDEEAIPLQQITPPGYDIISYPRSNGKTGRGLAVVYKSHTKLQNHGIMKNLKTMEIFENSIGTIRNTILFMGDFNIHMDRPEETNTIIFNDLLDRLNLRNNITFQTHISGHTLDLIIDNQNESLVKCMKKGYTFADHSPVQATIGIEK